MIIFFALSFVHYDPSYVIKQWYLCIEQVRVASIPPSNSFDDIAAMFRTFDMNLEDEKWFPIRALFAVLTLGLAWRVQKIYPERIAPFLVMALSAVYLMVFNPRTETVSYLILSPYTALFAALFVRERFFSWVLWLLIFLCIGFGSDCYGFLYNITKIWFKPFLASLFFILLTFWAFKKANARILIELSSRP
jgi:hypothetical protein